MDLFKNFCASDNYYYYYYYYYYQAYEGVYRWNK